MRAWRAGDSDGTESASDGLRDAHRDDRCAIRDRRLHLRSTGGERSLRDRAVGSGRDDGALARATGRDPERGFDLRAYRNADAAGRFSDVGIGDVKIVEACANEEHGMRRDV